MPIPAALRRIAAAAAITAFSMGAAQATVMTSVTYSPYGLPAATGSVNSIDLTGKVGQTGFTVNSGASAVTISTASGGAVVQGSSSGNYAAPVTGGTVANPTYWSAPYTSSGGTPGTVTFTFASAQSYFGLLWGSVDSGNYINFLDSAKNVIASVTGTDIIADANGSQGFGGSKYTLINLTGGQFTSLVMGQNGSPSFEAASFQYAARNVNVPEPASLALLATGLAAAGFGVVRRRKA